MHPKGSRKQFCPKGHDTFVTGRRKDNSGCQACYDAKHSKRVPKQFCPQGHDTFVVGRNPGGGCTECGRASSRTYGRVHVDEIIRKAGVKRRESPLLRLKSCLRAVLLTALKSKDWPKTSHFNEYIGCTSEELIAHMEKQFKPGMTWGNHTPTGWHADHIIPLSSAKTEAEMYKLCHYTNLQPLWAKDNLSKHDKMPSDET